jgi:soluble lytic murein transglycosylase-like protein
MAMTVAFAVAGFSSTASARVSHLASGLDKKEARAVAGKRTHASRSTRSGKMSYASRRAGKAKYAGSSRVRNKTVHRGGGNHGSLMATLAAVKPAGLPLSLAAAVITQESGWRVNARGSSGEIGLMQLMPATARQYGGGNLYNPAQNMRVGTRVLHHCYKLAGGNVAATIGCYNRGPGLMWSWNGRAITRRYVSNVHRMMSRS